jgi:CHAT domain-containing protein/tetratricopeptide (TPR) repeat protein
MLFLAYVSYASAATETAQCPPATQAEAIKLRAEVEDLKQGKQWNEAATRARCLVEVARQLFGPSHATTINLERDLASILRTAGRAEEAVLIEQQIRHTEGTAAGTSDTTGLELFVVRSKSLLERGDAKGAGDVCRQARDQAANRRLERSLVFALVLNECGRAYEASGDDLMAEQRYTEAAELARELGGPNSRHRAPPLNNLGLLYWKKDEPSRALGPLREALEIDGKNNPESIPTMIDLGLVLARLGREDEARGQYIAAEELTKRTYGVSHSHLISIYYNLGAQAWRNGRLDEAVDWHLRANTVIEENARSVLTLGSEQQKLDYMRQFEGDTYASISLGLALSRGSLRASRMALQTVLQRKGRVLDVMAENFSAARSSASVEDQQLFNAWQQTNAQYFTLLSRGPEQMSIVKYQALLDTVKGKLQELETRLGGRSPAFRNQAKTVTLEGVQRAIPADAVLLEYARYKLYQPNAKNNASRWGAARYVVYLLRGHGAPVAVDIGEAGPIEVAAEALRLSVSGRRSDVRQRARELDALILGKIRRLLGNASALLISPDGALNLVPFAALVDENGHYLIERYRLSYVTSGRDLVRQSTGTSSREPPLILGDAAFGGAFGSPDARGEGKRATDMGTLRFGPLPGTAREVQAIGQILRLSPDRILTREAASEAAVKAVKGPRILHLATHGFFLPDLPEAPTPDLSAPRAPAMGGNRADPLLRSGVALSGFNRRAEARSANDGVLTALEVVGLDLWGTEVVALSACDTAVGEVRAGEGVFGLRRALVLAGAESQLMTLWQVADEPTKDLMVSWYSQLQQRVGRMEALYQAQLAALRGKALPVTNTLLRGVKALEEPGEPADPGIAGARHPYYWASFILSGATGPISASKGGGQSGKSGQGTPLKNQ